jgi:hydrogenase maturation protease
MQEYQESTLAYDEPVSQPEYLLTSGSTTRVLVAGIGNIFCGDDGFGVQVAQRLLHRRLPAQIRVGDFGTRGFELACALDSAEVVILVDAHPHGARPGSLTVIEPDVDLVVGSNLYESIDEPFALDCRRVLQLARAMDVRLGRIILVGCQPQTLGGADGSMGLSAPVAAAVEDALNLVESLSRRALSDGRQLYVDVLDGPLDESTEGTAGRPTLYM